MWNTSNKFSDSPERPLSAMCMLNQIKSERQNHEKKKQIQAWPKTLNHYVMIFIDFLTGFKVFVYNQSAVDAANTITNTAGLCGYPQTGHK